MDRPESTQLQRYDLEPEPAPEPTVQDVIEGLADALSAAVELAEPQQTATRCLTLLARVQAAKVGYVDADELLISLRRLIQDWHQP